MQVTALYRYPVKSMLGERLEHCRIESGGVAGDRAYAVVDVETGTVATAKVPRWWSALLQCSARYESEPPGPVVITFPDGKELRSDDPGVDAALSELLGRPVRLTSSRPEGAAFEELWPDIDGLAPQALIDAAGRREETGEPISRFDIAAMAPGSTAFFDLAAVHVLAESTLEHLRGLAPGSEFDARRYRPNVVVDGEGEGFTENGWAGHDLTVGGVRLAVSIPTMRCVMTTLQHGDVRADADTLRTIAKHNRVHIPELGKWACAGAYADVASPGEVAVGDDVVN